MLKSLRSVLHRSAWLMLWAGLCSVLIAADSEVRTWSDSTGKFKIKAKMLSVDANKITLEKEDGTELEIELTKLSAADRKFLADLPKPDDNPFKSKSKPDDPFKTKTPGKATKPQPRAAVETRQVSVDLQSVARIQLSAPSDKWVVPVQSSVTVFDGKVKNCPLPPKTNFFEKLAGLAVNSRAKKAVVGYTLDDHRNPGTTRLVICDLSAGKTTSPIGTKGLMSPIALHDDGTHVLMRRDEFGFGKLDQLEIWNVKGMNTEREVSFTPYDNEKNGSRDVMWAAFLDAEHFITSSRAGVVVFWNFPSIEPEATLTLVDGAIPALSPDRKYLGYSNGTEIGILDLAQREVVAQERVDETLRNPTMAFSPSGHRLACSAGDKIAAWDVATGELLQVVPCTGIVLLDEFEYPDENFVLCGHTHLIDLEHQFKLWTYTGVERARCLGGWTFLAVTDGTKPGALLCGQLPHPPALDMAKKAVTDPSLFLVKAGTVVKINVDGIADATKRGEAQTALTKRLEAAGCKAGPEGSIELVATVEGPKETKVSFFTSGTYPFQEYVSRVKLVHQGQVVWETSGTNSPFMVRVPRGENIGTHLKTLEKPFYEFFDRVSLPKLLQKPTGMNMQTLGQSTVTVTGIR